MRAARTVALSRALSLALAAVLLAESAAFAQPRRGDLRSQLPPDARAAFDAAKELFDDANYAGALVEYARAQQISNDPRLGYYVGICEKSLLHYAKAIDAWQKELDESARLSAADVAELKNAIDVVRRYVTSITVTANVDGAALFVDEQPAGTTPLPGPVRVDVGKHVLRLSKAGYGDVTSNVDVASGTTPAFNLRLQPSQALVTVTVVGAPAAAIAVDKVDRGPAPFRGNLDPGAHTIEASASGFGTVSQTLDVSDAAPKTVTLAMSPEVHQGTLRITAPEGTSLFLDGQALGVGGWEGAVSSVGGHELVARRPGFQVYAVDVTVGDKEHKDFDVPLNKEVPTSWVIWGAGALLLVAGCVAVAVVVLKPADLSPFRGDLTPGITTARYGLHF